MFRHMGGVTKTFALEATPTGGGGANGWIDSMDEPGRAFAQSLMEFSRGSSSSQIPETSAISLEQEDDDDVSLGDEFVRSMTELGKANDRALELVKEGMAREFQFKDKAVEFMHLLDRAKGGDAEAQFAFARAFWSGTHGCAKEDEENSNKEDSGWGKCGNGWHWCNESADNGYCWAQLKKGVSKRNDAVESGSVEDHEKAIMWLDKALHHSEVRDKDREKAGVYSRALNNSRITLGKKYLTGKDVTPDFETAMSYFEAVAESGDSRGVELKDGAENLRNGLLANLADLKKRADAESGDALNELGMIYGAYSEFAQYQLVAKKDDHKSAEYFKKAVECHSLDGMDNLGNCYKKGRGVEKDIEMAAMWYRKAAESGWASGQYHYAVCLRKGDGVEKDEAGALRWFMMAGASGHVQSLNMLGWCAEGGRGMEEDPELAFEWYRLAAEAGDAKSMYELGRLYKNGYGCEEDETLGDEWQEKAAQNGYSGGW